MSFILTDKEKEILSYLVTGEEWRHDKELEDLMDRIINEELKTSIKLKKILETSQNNWRNLQTYLVKDIKNIPTRWGRDNAKLKEDIERTKLSIKTLKNEADNYIGEICEGLNFNTRPVYDKIESMYNEVELECVDISKDFLLWLEEKESKMNKTIEELKSENIKSIKSNQWEIDETLVKQYNIFYDKKYLKHESQIEEYFTDNGSEYFELGQGIYYDEVNMMVFVAGKYYNVKILADIGAQYCEHGDKVYYVDEIGSVSYKEIPKPELKEIKTMNFKVDITKDEQKAIEAFLEKKGINYTILQRKEGSTI